MTVMARVGWSWARAWTQTTIATTAAAAARNSLRIVSSPLFWPDRPPPSMRLERRPDRNSATHATSVNDTVHLQARDFVLHQQLATLQLHDLKIVDRRMRASFGNFRLERLMPSFEFRKMGFYGHVGGFSSARSFA